jgi:hypothetical protein
VAIVKARRGGALGALGSTFPTQFAPKPKSAAVFSLPAKASVAARLIGRPPTASTPPSSSLVPIGRPPASSSSFTSAISRAFAPSTVPSSSGAPSSPSIVGNFLNSILGPGKFGAPTTGAAASNLHNVGFSPTQSIAKRLANPATYAPQTANAAAVQAGQVPSSFPSNVLPLFPASPSGGDDSGGGGSGGGGGGGDPGPASDDNYGDQSDLPDYGGDDGSTGDDDDTGDSGGYSEQGGGGPSDTYAFDQPAIEETEGFNPPDVESRRRRGIFQDPDHQDSAYADGAGYDNDDDESTGGQDMYAPGVSTRAPDGADESWSWRDRPRPHVPHHMYMSPRDRPGGEEGDDDMDASDYVSALEGYDSPGMGGFSDFLTSLGKQVGVTALNASANALGAKAPAKTLTIPPAPPLSAAAKIGIAIAVALPVAYLVMKNRSAPAVVHNPRRRRRRRR